MTLTFADATPSSIPVHLVHAKEQPDLDGAAMAWIAASGFNGGAGRSVVIPNTDGGIAAVVIGLGDAVSRKRSRFVVAQAVTSLPAGDYDILTDAGADMDEVALGWLLAGYVFDRYKDVKPAAARLVAPKSIDADRITAIANGEALTRDLINTPASDMGPQELEDAFVSLAKAHGAKTNIITGDDLLDQNFPMVHTVGRASPRAPRLLEMNWGTTGPRLTLVGKGVCFDTGGLNLKPGASMGLMKKDMGGAATVLGLAQMIMETGLPIQLRVLVPAVENAVDGSAFRPQDVLTSRKGLTVEINNTDAEGRLVLADALAYATEEPADLVISMATLTGAARVAVGPDLAPFYTDDDAVASTLALAGGAVCDPLWRMPFWDPYETMIEPAVADLDNAPAGGFAGSITAALFLRRFVNEDTNYVHFDIYGWQPVAKPARPKGGVGQGARAVFEALPTLLEL